MNCSKCKKALVSSDLIKCTSACEGSMHYGCGGLSEQDFKRILPMNLKKWKCTDCKSVKKGSSTSDSPSTPLVINERLDSNVDHMPSILSIDTEALMNNMNAKFAQLTRDMTEHRNTFNGRIDGLADKIENWSSKFSQLEGTIRSMRDDINGISSNNVEIRAELSGLRSETAELRSETVELRSETVELRIENEQLRKSMDECDYKKSLTEANETITKLIKENNTSKQFSMMNNLEISGVPFSKGENLFLILRKICVKVGFTLQNSDVDSIHRVRRYQSAENSTQKNLRPPGIIVRFTQRKRKDELLSAVRARRGITTADIELPGPAFSVYIGDHLTPDNKLLLKRAREIKNELHYSYLWIRDCRILMRKKDNTKITPEMIVDSLRELSFWHDPIQFNIILKYIKDRFPVNPNLAELEKELRQKLRVSEKAGIVTGDKRDRWRLRTGLERLRQVPETLLTLFWQLQCDVINPLADKIKRKSRPVIIIQKTQDSDSDSLPSDG